MELRELHVLSALDPSDLSTVRVWFTGQVLYKHFLTKILRCWQPNPVLTVSWEAEAGRFVPYLEHTAEPGPD